MKKKNKLWLVKREVIAPDIKSAMTKAGIICEIQQAAYPPGEDKQVGFKSNKMKKR